MTLRSAIGPGIRFLLATASIIGFSTTDPTAVRAATDPTDTRPAADLRPTLTFAENRGQWPEAIHYAASVPGALIELGPTGATYVISRPTSTDSPTDPTHSASAKPAPLESIALRASFPGSRLDATLAPEQPAANLSHYYLGNDPTAWRTNVPNFGAIRYDGLYPGIDLVYHGADGRLEYDFEVEPGADWRVIRVQYDGFEKLQITANGDLALTTRFGTVIERAPVAWQVIDGARHPVRAGYRRMSKNTFGFEIFDPIDPAASLIIDPVLHYGTYLGGSVWDEMHGVDYNFAGEAWVVGGTRSPDFPATGSPVPSTKYSVCLTRMAANGQSQVWSVFLGGSEDQIGYGLDLDVNDNAYISGFTGSNNFPTTAGCYDATFNGTNPGETDLFVAKLSSTGALLYSTYLGGTDSETNSGLVLGPSAQVYVSADAGQNYPTTAGCYDATQNGGSDVVLSVLNPVGSGPADLVYSTYVGGSTYDESHGLAVDVSGYAWIAGATLSSDYPATGGPPFNGTADAFITQIKPNGAGPADLGYSEKFGGTGNDYGLAVATEFIGVAFTGVTSSSNFPVTSGVFQPTYGGGSSDAFVMFLLPSSNFVFYSTYLGGTGADQAGAAHLSFGGRITAAGSTGSPNFPTTAGAYDTTPNGNVDMFLARFDFSGATLLEGTFIGGSGDDYLYDFAEDLISRRYVTGTTTSGNFPVTATAFDTSFGGSPIDGVVLKFQPPHPEVCAACASPPDTCCARAPKFLQAEPAPSLSPNVLVGTRNESTPTPYAVTVYDLGSPTPTEDVEWTTISRYNGPGAGWLTSQLGTVFGLTLDEYGNIFVTHASCYDGDQVGTIPGAGPGAVYRIDANTGGVTTFCRLPNYPDPNVIAGQNYPALGNISYDCRHKQFFVTNLEDGRIYRIKPNGPNGVTGTIQEVFDPGVADTGPTNYLTPIGSVPSPGWAPLGERLWGVQWHMDRVYYGVWIEDISAPSSTLANEVRSVALNAAGAFVTSSDQHELYVQPLSPWDYSMPVSDISFHTDGRMLLGERGIDNTTATSPHNARSLEYRCEGGCWVSANQYQVGVCCAGANSAGGVDYDHFPYTGSQLGRVWSSGEALHLGYPGNSEIFGYQGSRPSGGSNLTGIIIDDDGDNQFVDKTTLGDVESPGCVSTANQVCGRKFSDANRNGIQDNGEPALLGWPIVLNGPGGPYQAFTDEQGNYCFADLPPGMFTLGEINRPGWIQTAPPGGVYPLTLTANQNLTGYDFGNYACATAPQCIPAPPGLAAWFTFDEGGGMTLANDNTHLDPSRNALHLGAGATFSPDGRVGNALQCFGPAALASAPVVEQLDLDFGTGSFALDAWLNPASSVQSPRVVAEKRQLVSAVPYRTRGWSLYLSGQQLMLEIGTSEITGTFPGPTIPGNSWTFVAVSVDRVAATGTWYLNGAPVPGFDFSPPSGSLFNNADLLVGGRPGAPSWNGLIDELQFFGTPLSAQSIAAVAAAPAGKCREHCRVPAVTSICKDKPTVTICMNIVNQTNAPQSYHWSVAGLPSGPGCSVAGPVTFSPSSGTIVVPAGGISSPICITMTRPAGLINQNDTACFEFSFVNDATGVCRACVGKIRADNTCWCVTPAQPGVVAVGQRFAPGITGQPIVIGIKHPCDPVAVIDYRVTAVYEPGAHPDPLAVSLNGLPPGEPVLGSLSLDTEGETEVTVMATYPRAYDPAGLYQVVMEADTDGDGIMEVVSSTPIASTYEADAVSTVPDVAAPPVPLVSLKALPNPFQAKATLSVTLPVAGPVDLAVYDLSGRLIRRVFAGSVAAGPSTFLWDGRDEAGRETGGGIYFVRLVSGGVRQQAKLVRVR